MVVLTVLAEAGGARTCMAARREKRAVMIDIFILPCIVLNVLVQRETVRGGTK